MTRTVGLSLQTMFDLGPDFDPLEFIKFAIGRGHCELLDMSVHDFGENWCSLKMPYATKLAGDNESGIMASGPIFALLDMASGMSIGLAQRDFSPRVTLDLRVDYLRPALPGATVFARTECYRRTKSVAFVRGHAHDGDESKPVAQMAGTFMFVDGV
jgi:uncharacterized protein (TIGR00369 family)